MNIRRTVESLILDNGPGLHIRRFLTLSRGHKTAIKEAEERVNRRWH